MVLPGNVASGDLIASAWGNQTSNAVGRLFSYVVPRITFNGNVTVNASGAFAITTGFTPTAALCVTTQQLSVPFVFATITLDATQCVFRAFNPSGASPNGSVLGVSYVIFGLPAVP